MVGVVEVSPSPEKEIEEEVKKPVIEERQHIELEPNLFSLKQTPGNMSREQREHNQSYMSEDFQYNERELAKCHVSKKGQGGLHYRVERGKKGEVFVNMPFLTKLFHDSVDYDRIIEIDKQDLVLQADYNPHLLFQLFTGGSS